MSLCNTSRKSSISLIRNSEGRSLEQFFKVIIISFMSWICSLRLCSAQNVEYREADIWFKQDKFG